MKSILILSLFVSNFSYALTCKQVGPLPSGQYSYLPQGLVLTANELTYGISSLSDKTSFTVKIEDPKSGTVQKFMKLKRMNPPNFQAQGGSDRWSNGMATLIGSDQDFGAPLEKTYPADFYTEQSEDSVITFACDQRVE
jgi:hypothetical protein